MTQTATIADTQEISRDWGGLRRLTPISRTFGLDRGSPIDRYYIEGFLERYSADIRGRVLEIGDSSYTRRFGGSRVERAEVLHATGTKHSTIIGDLAQKETLPADAFDCMVLTQTFHVMYDVPTALANCSAALKPGGVLLATLAGISQISRYDMDRWGDFWRFTSLSARKVFERSFPSKNITVEAFGNVVAAIGFLHGLATHELTSEELDYRDDDYQMLITVRAVKHGGTA